MHPFLVCRLAFEWANSLQKTLSNCPQHCLEVSTDAQLKRLLAEAEQAVAVDNDEDDALYCCDCRQEITRRREGISVSGSHKHSFTNPHSICFRIGCFLDAPGCVRIGAQTYEYTWFAGYAWCIAVCSVCGVHLGWEFRTGDGDRFFGLILDRLLSARDSLN